MKYTLLLFYIMTIIAIIFIERKRPTEALFWVLVVTLIPYFGIVLYLVFGDTLAIKITTYFRKKRLKKDLPLLIKDNEQFDESILLSDEDKEVINFNYKYNKSKLTSYDDYQFFIDGKSHYEQLYKDIDNAKECVYVEFYTIHNDMVGHEFVKHLTEKAKEGVKVIVLCDFIANIGTPNKVFKELKKFGGEVIRIKPFITHYRSHRKLVVIDRCISYIGGMNIGKKYINISKKKNPWRDTQVRLIGSCSNLLNKYFLKDYLCSIKNRKLKSAINYVNTLELIENKINNNLCQFIAGGVESNKEAIKMSYLSMIRSAKKSILIQTPYFVPDASILDSLKTAIASGVDVTLTIAGVKSSFFLDPVTTYYIGQLLEYGAHIYKYNGYIHAKTMIIDDELCCIGSVNMDERSFKIDDEICGIFYENKLVEDYKKIYMNDLKNSKEYTYKEFNDRTNLERLKEGIFLLFSPLM